MIKCLNILFILNFVFLICKLEYVDRRASSKRHYVHTREELALTHNIIINQPQCKSTEWPIFIHSSASLAKGERHWQRRMALRETWIKEIQENNLPLKIFFVLGMPSLDKANVVQPQLLKEAEQFGDILQFGFIDDYYNQTLKQLSWMAWTMKKCRKKYYLIKLKDEVLVNVQALLKNLKSKAFKHGISGHFGDSSPAAQTNQCQPYYLPEDVYPNETFPTYIDSFGYVMTTSSLELLYETAFNQVSQPVLDIDSIYMTGIVADLANVSRYNTTEFMTCNLNDNNNHNPNCCKNACVMLNASVFSGCRNHEQMRELYAKWKILEENETEENGCVTQPVVEAISTTLCLIILLLAIFVVGLIFYFDLLLDRKLLRYHTHENIYLFVY